MDRFRLRGTWEEDPAPIPFPRQAPGRHAGQKQTRSPADRVPVTKLSERTRELMNDVDAHFERLQLNFDEFRNQLEAQNSSFDDGPSAA